MYIYSFLPSNWTLFNTIIQIYRLNDFQDLRLLRKYTFTRIYFYTTQITIWFLLFIFTKYVAILNQDKFTLILHLLHAYPTSAIMCNNEEKK